MEKTLENAAIHEIARLERGLPVLATIANIAPIIGFLGTVVGMILAFANIEKLARMEPREVAAGIKVALLTTAGERSFAFRPLSVRTGLALLPGTTRLALIALLTTGLGILPALAILALLSGLLLPVLSRELTAGEVP